MALQKNKIYRAELMGYTAEGAAVARIEGMAVFVPGGASGDQCDVKIVKVQKNLAFGRIEQIVRPSRERIEPACPYAARCGGCCFQHITYEEELRAKQQRVEDALRRIGRGKGGEYQLTDAIELLIREGHPVHIVIHDGFRHDLGNPGGFIKACVDFGLRHPAYAKSLRRYLERRLPQGDSPDFCDEESAAGAKGAGEA